MTDITDKKQAIESIALSIKGVIGIGIGLSKQDKPIIKIFVNNQFNQSSLPKELIAPDIELEYIDEITAQQTPKI